MEEASLFFVCLFVCFFSLAFTMINYNFLTHQFDQFFLLQYHLDIQKALRR